jgi:SAM-dependent methyltransferase
MTGLAGKSVMISEAVTDQNFDEFAYLASNPDVAHAVAEKRIPSGLVHFMRHGRSEGRTQRTPPQIVDAVKALRVEKLAALTPLLARPALQQRASGALDYLDDTVRSRHGLDSMDVVSQNNYDNETLDLIGKCQDGLILDAGAGARPIYFGNVINLEIFEYASTDVMAPGEDLPFKDSVFEGVLSIAVLEHVRDPFRCAAEIARVLKPGGWLKCCVPFLQPLHGYPHHYYNMTHEGLRALFSPHLEIERQEVTDPLHPVWSISWQLRSWASALPPMTQRKFLGMRVKDLIGDPALMLHQPYAQELPMSKRFELAAATLLYARKRAL